MITSDEETAGQKSEQARGGSLVARKEKQMGLEPRTGQFRKVRDEQKALGPDQAQAVDHIQAYKECSRKGAALDP